MHIRAGFAIALLVCLPGMAAASLQCSETDRLGNHSVATIKTDKDGAIESFYWYMRTPEGATCEFDSRQFAYAPQGRTQEYRSAKGCRLFIWEQGNAVTLAHNACEAHCTAAAAHDYLWPIVFDKSGKDCGRKK
jgi:hypothetical protein